MRVIVHLIEQGHTIGGCGNVADAEIAGFTIPNAALFGATTMAEHCNHIHVGY